jgi:hypothetical protein
LEETKEELEREMQNIGNYLKTPPENPNEPPFHHYSLRGVITDSYTTYVLVNPNTAEDLIDTVMEDWQWWQISFRPDETEAVSWKVGQNLYFR